MNEEYLENQKKKMGTNPYQAGQGDYEKVAKVNSEEDASNQDKVPEKIFIPKGFGVSNAGEKFRVTRRNQE